MANVIPIVLACDERFAPHAAVTIASLLANAAPDTTYSIYFLHAGLSARTVERLKSLHTLHPLAAIKDVPVGSAFRHAPRHEKLPTAAYYRLIAHTMLDEDKVIYLDSDVVVTKDLSPLYATDLGNNYIGAVQSPGARQGRIATNPRTGEPVVFLDYLQALGLPTEIAKSFYVNTGVLLINSRQMRDDNMEARFKRLIENADYLFAADQDVLSVCTGARKLLLDITWNFQVTLPKVRDLPQVRAWMEHHPRFDEQIEKYMRETPAIVHFVDLRPWDPGSRVPVYDDLYWRYLTLTPWKHTRYRRTLRALVGPVYRLMRRLSRFLRTGGSADYGSV